MRAQLPPANQLLAQIWEMIQQKDIPRAVNACQAMNNHYPDHANGWYASSFLALQLGGYDQALKMIDQALALQPENQRWLLHRVSCLQSAGTLDLAISSLHELTGREHSDKEIWGELGLIASSLGQYNLALQMFQKGVGLNPGQGRLHFNLATVYRFLGKLEEAESSCNRAIELNSKDYDACYLRSNLRKQTEQQNHIDELLAVGESAQGNLLGEALLSYSLAKEYEDLGDFSNSFSALSKGATSRRKSLQYDAKADINFIDAIIQVYNKDFMSGSHPGHHSKEPIFVLGLPRTGTTLIERILGSHDSVTSAGELTNFTRQLAGMAQMVAQNSPEAYQADRNDMVEMTTRIDFRQLGQFYIESTRPLSGQTQHFIDKFPQNSLNLGPIHKALPNAKLVLLQRNPMDSCYSMYKQLFTEIYQFSYDLEELGHYFIAHQKLMKHWMNVIPNGIHIVEYENLIANTETEVRALLKFCELEWQDQCLEFHQNTQASTTASASQIRQKLYSTSIGKWKNYEEQLEPLRQMLADAGLLD